MITDEQGQPVTINRLKTAIEAILKNAVSRLLIFYSGHGICSQVGDYWLLSKYDTDADESVNVLQSMRSARRLGVGQIAIFSDACRSSLARAAFVTGRVIFPSGSRSTTISPYDEFLSTDIGDASQELTGEDPSKSYGVFSRCVLNALQGIEPEAAEDRAGRKIVSSISLANWLEKAVPLQSGKIPGGIVQYPSITPSWRAPNDEYVDYVQARKAAELASPQSDTRRTLDWIAGNEGLGLTARRKRLAAAKARVEHSASERKKRVEERSSAFLAQRGRESFETRQGLTIVGGAIIEVVAPPGVQTDFFRESGAWHVRGYAGPHSVAIQTDRKYWIGATILPEFIATLVTSEIGVESLNYESRRPSPDPTEYLQSETIVAEWNALLSVEGRVRPSGWEEFAQKARQFKHVNPAFGILAAYAYERSGSIDQIANIAWYFVDRNGFVPFDVVALLHSYGDPTSLIAAQGPVPPKIVVGGGFTSLTRGWSLLDVEGGSSDKLVSLRAGLTGSVWTTFDEQSGYRFADMVRCGEIL